MSKKYLKFVKELRQCWKKLIKLRREYMDAKFEQAIKRVLEFEGGYVNDPNDSGGETKYGISRRSYPNLDIRNLSLDGAKLIYYRDFWEPQLYGKFRSAEVAAKVFDLAVNTGTSTAHTLLQRALRAVGNPVKEDGILGKVTLNAVNSADEKVLLAALKSEAAGHYRCIVSKNVSQNKFINGWLKRAYF
jgi:lysozyme family protein